MHGLSEGRLDADDERHDALDIFSKIISYGSVLLEGDRIRAIVLLMMVAPSPSTTLICGSGARCQEIASTLCLTSA